MCDPFHAVAKYKKQCKFSLRGNMGLGGPAFEARETSETTRIYIQSLPLYC